MLQSSIPAKFTIPFGNSAGAGYIRTIPTASQIGIQSGAASLTDGFPPLTFVAAGAGGVSPFGEDMNGILKQITQWNQWQSAGGPVIWDSAFSAAVGGYPLGAIVMSGVTLGLMFISLVDNNISDPDTGGSNWTGFQISQTVPAMQGRLSYTSGTACMLSPVNGGLMWINGLNYSIPSAGVNLSNGSLSASTLYYVYAYMSGLSMTLEASTTGYAAASNGVQQKIGAATRTLVGMVYMNGSGQFVSQDGSLQVLTYYMRALKRSRSQFSATRTTTSSSFNEINNEIRNSFLVWANENVDFDFAGSTNATNGQNTVTGISFDGAAAEQETCAAASGVSGIGISGTKVGLSEGLHYATLFGAVGSGAGTGTWYGVTNTSAGQAQTTMTISLQG
jgi:hypothetical protein